MKFLFFISITILTFQINAQNAEKYYEMAEEKLSKNDFNYALALMNKAIELDIDNKWYKITRLEILIKTNGINKAIEEGEKLLIEFPEFDELHNRLGSYYESTANFKKAIQHYDKAIAFSRNDTIKNSYILNRGSCKKYLKDYKSAISDLETAYQFNPNDIGVLNNYAYLHMELKQYKLAIEKLNKIISLDSTFEGSYVNLGFLYTDLDKYELALTNFNKAIEINPKQSITYNNRGYLYYKMGKYNDALNDINFSLMDYPSNSYAYRNLALVNFAKKQY